MTNLVQQIQTDMVAAMKSREETKLSVIRMLKSAVQLAQVEKGKDNLLTDDEVLVIVRRLIKQRFLAFFRIWARTVRQIPTRYAPVRHFVLNYSDSSKRRPLGQSRSARPVVLKQGETTLARSLFSFCPAPRKQRSTCMC